MPKPSAGSSPPQGDPARARFCVSSPRPWGHPVAACLIPELLGKRGEAAWAGACPRPPGEDAPNSAPTTCSVSSHVGENLPDFHSTRLPSLCPVPPPSPIPRGFCAREGTAAENRCLGQHWVLCCCTGTAGGHLPVLGCPSPRIPAAVAMAMSIPRAPALSSPPHRSCPRPQRSPSTRAAGAERAARRSPLTTGCPARPSCAGLFLFARAPPEGRVWKAKRYTAAASGGERRKENSTPPRSVSPLLLPCLARLPPRR